MTPQPDVKTNRSVFGSPLSRKGLAVISIPLFVSLFFIGFLKVLLDEAQAEAAREARSRQILRATNQLGSTMIRAVSDYMLDTMLPEEYNRSRFQIASENARKRLSELEALLPASGSQRELSERIRRELDALFRLYSEQRGSRDTMSMLEISRRMNALRMVTRSLLEDLGKLTTSEETNLEAPARAVREYRRMIDMVLALAVVLNMVLAAVLMLAFGRNISDRLFVLMDNSNRLVEEKELNRPVEGKDEIAELDGAIHEAASKLREARAREREIIKLKQSFLAMVGHELKSPLMSIDLCLDLLGKGFLGNLTDEGKATIKAAVVSTQRLISLVNEILDAERLESGAISITPAAANLADIMEMSLDSVSALAGAANIDIKAETIDCHIEADKNRIVQVIINLLTNAIKFSPQGSTIELSGRCGGGYAEISVKDAGRGVPLDQQQLIFERFHQVIDSDASEKGGAGLGLAICKAIIDAHKGAIGVESVPGKGSRFWFTLPLS